jgi:hypothetical protein
MSPAPSPAPPFAKGATDDGPAFGQCCLTWKDMRLRRPAPKNRPGRAAYPHLSSRCQRPRRSRSGPKRSKRINARVQWTCRSADLTPSRRRHPPQAPLEPFPAPRASGG